MDGFKNNNFTELSVSEMKQVQGGNYLDDVLKVVEGLGGNLNASAAVLGMSVQQLRDMLGL